MAEARGDVRDDEISFRCCEFQPRRGDFRPESKEWSDSAGRFAERDEDLNLWFADNTRITLSKTLSGDPIGDGRSSPDVFSSATHWTTIPHFAEECRFAVLVMLSSLWVRMP